MVKRHRRRHLLYNRKLHATVFGIDVGDGASTTVAFCNYFCSRDAEGDESVLDGFGAVFRKLLVVLVRTNIVGVSRYLHSQVGIGGEELGKMTDFAHRFGLQVVLVKIEEDIFDDNAEAVLDNLVDGVDGDAV